MSLTGANRLKSIEDFKSINTFAEDGVLAIEPVAWDEGHEELGSIGVGSSVGHGHVTSLSVLDSEVLISEFFSIDGLSSSTVAGGEISTLSHELSNDSVESATFVVERLS